MSGLRITQYFPFVRMKIEKQTVHIETSRSALIHLMPDQRYRPLCHDCGAAATVHLQGYPISTSELEGANKKIEVTKSKVYWFHDTHYYVLKAKQAFAA